MDQQAGPSSSASAAVAGGVTPRGGSQELEKMQRDLIGSALAVTSERVAVHEDILTALRRQMLQYREWTSEASTELRKIFDAATDDLTTLERLETEYLMRPDELFKASQLCGRIDLVLATASVFYHELERRTTKEPQLVHKLFAPSCPFFRACAMRGQPISVDVTLIAPACAHILPSDSARATLVSTTTAVRRRSSTPGRSFAASSATAVLESSTARWDKQTNSAHFELRCTAGSNMRPMALSVALPVKQIVGTEKQNSSALLPLTPSSIVITNSIQWMDAEGVLLFERLWGEIDEVSWSRFCNTLQRFYVESTRQNPADPLRPLSTKDFALFAPRMKVVGSVVSPENWSAFWPWFGGATEKVRHQRALAPMALNCEFAGFLPRAEAETLLRGQSSGTAIIRFSDRNPGRIAVAFVRGERIVHTLVPETEGSGAKRGVLEFLRSVSEVKSLLIVKRDPWLGDVFGISTIPKKEVLYAFLGQDRLRRPDPVAGYEDVSGAASSGGFRQSRQQQQPDVEME